CMQYIHMPLTF
nr:immunoglobulin light chain junction region [Macaca mulatta]MOV80278.1 immunoglobulin light chain junction region [Macaca mulatta]MOV82769.1 immunoglobulin light chain junction region [Macaca mulatta]MOV82784.1 immunoglobulin light chain junction region [Macaca mulatta]MOV83104.1 immunoglobulin light chain junction region [Macaca mulatta]